MADLAVDAIICVAHERDHSSTCKTVARNVVGVHQQHLRAPSMPRR